MTVTFSIIIIILAALLFDSYRRNSAMAIEKKQLAISQETTVDVSDRILNTHDPASFYQYILESCLKLVPEARCSLILRLSSEGFLTVWSSEGCRNDEAYRISLKPEESYLYIATEGKLDRAVMFNQPGEADKETAAKSIAKGCGFQSEISAPLHLNGEFVGILCINGDQCGIFTDQDLNMIRYMAKQINIFMKYQKQNDEIQFLSRFDSLSRLMNRAAFDREIVKLLNDPSKDMANLNFILIDLNDLKAVNSMLGTHIGDEIIRNFAEILKKHLGKNDFCGRYGGDEFAVVIQGNSINVNQVLEDVNKEFTEDKKELGDKSFSPSFRYGRATFQEGQRSLEQLYSLADRRLYEMKKKKH